MDDLPVNILDAVILGVLLLSGLVGFFRGFIREVLSLAAWIGAGWVALTYFPEAREFVSGYVENNLFAGVLAGGGLFLTALILLMIVARLLARGAERTRMLGPLDRILGLLFGGLRGAVIVCVAYLFVIQMVTDAESEPSWVANSRLLPHVMAGAEMVKQLIPQDIQDGYTSDVNEGLDQLIKHELRKDEAGSP